MTTKQGGQYPQFTAFYVSTKAWQDLLRLCEITGRSRSAVLRQALDQLLRAELPYQLAAVARQGKTAAQ